MLTHEAGCILSVSRGLQVLRTFRASRAPLSNAEIVRRTGMSKAAASRLTSTLLQLGYLRRAPGSREFELGAGPVSLGDAYVQGSQLLHRAKPLMQELADRVGASVALAIGDGLEMLYVGYCVSRRIATLRLGVGSLLPMGTTSIGRAWLSIQPVPQRTALVAALQRQAGTGGPALQRAIEAGFAELQETDVCSVLGEYQRDVFGLSTPLRVGSRRIPMALSCGAAGLGSDLKVASRQMAAPLRVAAENLEACLADIDGMP